MKIFTELQKVVAAKIHRIDFAVHVPKSTKQADLDANMRQIKAAYSIWFSIFANCVVDLAADETVIVSEVSLKLDSLVDVIQSRSYAELAEQCTILYDMCRRGVSRYSAFKRQSDRELLQVMNPWLRRWVEARDISNLRIVLTLTQFPFRTVIRDSNLQEQMLSDYLSIESELKQPKWDGNEPVVQELNGIICKWMKPLKIDPEKFTPCHGGGVVSEGNLTLLEKDLALAYDPQIDYLLRKSGYTQQDFCPSPLTENAHRESKTQFVPKNATKLRTVSAQSCNNMYFQKGVQREIYKYISHHRYLRWHIPLREQDVCRDLCLVASRYSALATIDQSAASDRISWRLVQRLFRGTPLLLWLKATRDTVQRLPNGDVVEVVKFAPMGSALCFPIMSLVFAACVEFVRQTTHDWGRQWTVYGDDIIVPNEWVKPLSMLIEHLGMKVNFDKSFTGFDVSYRESCGVESWNGIDVTPFRFPRTLRITSDQKSAEEFEAYTDMALTAVAKYDFHFTRYFITSVMMKAHQRRLVFGDVDVTRTLGAVSGRCRDTWIVSGGRFYSPQPTNYHLRQCRPKPLDWARKNPFHPDSVDYQRQIVRGLVVKRKLSDRNPMPPLGVNALNEEGEEIPVDIIDATSDAHRYFHWLMHSRTRDQDEGNDQVIDHPELIRWLHPEVIQDVLSVDAWRAIEAQNPYTFRRFTTPYLKMGRVWV